MVICDRCGRGGDVHTYCFGQAAANFPGLIGRDLCSDCAQAFAKLLEVFTLTPDEPNHYGTQEWQEKLKSYEVECREREREVNNE